MSNKVRYSAIVLDDASHALILSNLDAGDGAKLFAHHMTLCLGALPEDKKHLLGKEVHISCSQIGLNPAGTALALKVDDYERLNPGTPHITVATYEGGKPKDSQDIINWVDMATTLYLTGTIQEVI